MSMITATTWVPRGFAAPFPTKYVFDEDEFERISSLAKLQLDDAKDDLEEAQNEQKEKENDTSGALDGLKTTDEMDDDLKEYDLEHYDDDEQEGGGDTMAMFGNIKNLVYHEENEDDPYITMPGQDEEDDEREELQILATDNLVLAGRIEDDVAHLEVYVYEDADDNLYVHHDIMLPSIPLAVEWIDLPAGKADKNAKGNFVAVGTMEPDIELWNLDVVDSMYPDAILGQGAEDGAKPKKKKKKSKKANEEFHVDAVLSLAANRQHRNLLASASADKTIKLWDLNTTKCAKSYSYHNDKVCSLAWHAKESTILLSGSYDRTVVAADMRAPDAVAPRWGVESDVETVRWDPHDPNYFYVSTENGVIHYHDVRNAPSNPLETKPVWILQAHDESISSFDVNPIIPGFIATGSTDKQVKLWNIQASGPSMVVSRDLGVGKVFSTSFAPDQEVGFRLAVAGSKGAVQIWDTSTNAAVRAAFASKVPEMHGEVKERLVGIEEDDTDSDSEEGEENDDEDDGGESMEE
ncbi:WD40 repeat-like protein [Delitschia confertaspora ATCC 74209]|uniref:WD40 repeat-like protein n=1 Tax=Delitschia confertaspora ATCC 74209 TaxID=1513339 RepID=A0A9P4JVX0_9PLEO|nr:WD40 repeat-like protein [Delitschia confertaspora ATCC 74209]